MNETIKKLIDAISKAKIAVVDDVQLMKEILIFKKYHCDYEIYNVLSFYITAPKSTQLDAVKSISNWRKHLNKDYLNVKDEYIKKPLVALVPFYENNEIKLKLYKVYDISQIDIDEELRDLYLSNQKSELEKIMREETNKKLLFLCCRRDSNWGFKAILSYLNQNDFFSKQNEEFKRYIKTWMCVVFCNELALQRHFVQDDDLVFKESFKVSKEQILNYLSDLIEKFHFYFYMFLKNYAQNEIKRLKKEKLKQLDNQGIQAAVEMVTKVDYSMQEMAEEIINLKKLGEE